MRIRFSRLRALALAGAMAAGLLCTPASAEDLSVTDGVKPISYEFLDADGQAEEYPASKDSFQVGVNYVKTGTFRTYPVEGFYTIPVDASLRLTNRGAEDECYITISVVAFQEMGKEEILAQYGKKIDKYNSASPEDPVELEEDETYYVYTETDWGGKYLCEDGSWINGASRPENILQVEKRDSTVFSLPGAAEGNLYRVDFQVYYPPSRFPEQYYFWRLYVKTASEAESAPGEEARPDGQPEEDPQSPSFTDVPETAWYAKPVAWAVEEGVTSGTDHNTFSPEQTCTTAEILTFLWRSVGSPQPEGEAMPFSDVPEDAYYGESAIWAWEQGLVSGTRLGGDDPCTRASAMIFLWKLAGSPAAEPSGFSDVDADAPYAQAVAWAVEEGITGGTGSDTFSPDEICSRSQIVTFLYQNFAQTE